MIYPLTIKQAYNFEMRAPAILGISYNNAIVKGIVDYDTAKTIQDVTPLHAAAYPFLESGTPRNVEELTFIKIKTMSGEMRVIAMEWLAAAPVLVTSNNARFTIQSVSVEDIQVIKEILIQNGFNKFEVEVF